MWPIESIDVHVMNGHHFIRYFRLCEKSKKGQLSKRLDTGLLVMENIGVSTLLCVEQFQRNPACTIEKALNPRSIRHISIRIKRRGNETVFAIKKGRRVTI